MTYTELKDAFRAHSYKVAREYKYFALSEFGRVGGAITVYDVGDKKEVIASLKGNPGSFKSVCILSAPTVRS